MSYMGKEKPTIALTASDIVDGAITTDKLIADAVTSAKIDDGTIVNADINAAAAIVGTKLADDAITTVKILDNNVTLAKMADGTQGDTLYYGAAGAPTLLAKPGTPADEVLTFATGASAPSWAAASSGGLLGIVIYTGNGTYTPGNTDNGTAGDEGNASVTKVIVEVQAGGGGSGAGGGTPGSLYGASAGGGSYAKQFISTLTAATVVVGSGGTQSVTGGTSSWTDSSNTISCLGGVGGTTTVGGLGGVVTATGAFIKIDGQPGTTGGKTGGYPVGGDSFLGIGGRQSLSPTTIQGKVATGYGGGGGCGFLNTSLTGHGTDGIVIIAEYA